jgi:preprotein translocase subunit YajC
VRRGWGSIFKERSLSEGPASAGRFGKKAQKTTTMMTIEAMLPQSAFFLLQAGGQPSSFTLFLPLILIMVIFYFLMIMPAQRRQKKVAEMLKNLKNGDKVITSGGVYGTIVGLEDDAIQLRIAEQVKIKVSRSAIAGLQAEPKEN